MSYPTRNFAIAKRWVYLLFEEFFNQGDLEKASGLPVSFLCDREKTDIAVNQPGFLNFIVIPLFKAMTEVLPECDLYLTKAQENVLIWKDYQETETDKQVYKKDAKSESELSSQVGKFQRNPVSQQNSAS